MKKRYILSLVSIITIVLGINYVFAEKGKLKNEQILFKAFEEVDANFKNFNTSYNSKISNEFTSLEKLKEISQDISKSLELKEVHTEEIEDKNMNQINLYASDSNNRNVTVITYSYEDKKSDKKGTTLFIDVSENKDYKQMNEVADKLSNIFNKYGVQAEVNSCIIGTFDGELPEEMMNRKINKIKEISSSEEVESLKNESLISMSMYTKNIDRHIYSGAKKMNLNVSMRYNNYNNKTHILIGTPVITVAY